MNNNTSGQGNASFYTDLALNEIEQLGGLHVRGTYQATMRDNSARIASDYVHLMDDELGSERDGREADRNRYNHYTVAVQVRRQFERLTGNDNMGIARHRIHTDDDSLRVSIGGDGLHVYSESSKFGPVTIPFDTTTGDMDANAFMLLSTVLGINLTRANTPTRLHDTLFKAEPVHPTCALCQQQHAGALTQDELTKLLGGTFPLPLFNGPLAELFEQVMSDDGVRLGFGPGTFVVG